MKKLGEIQLSDFNPSASKEAKVIFWADVSFDEVKEYDENPMVHAQGTIDLSIDEFQYSNCSITADENWVLLGGHGTRKSLMRNYKSIPYMIQVMGFKSEEDKIAFRMMLNKSGHDSVFNTELARRNFERLAAAHYDMLKTGFNEAETQAYLDTMREETSRNVEEILARVGDGQGNAVTVKEDKDDDWTKDEFNPLMPPSSAPPVTIDYGSATPQLAEKADDLNVSPTVEVNRPYMVYMVFSTEPQAQSFLSSIGISANFQGRQLVHVDMRMTDSARRDEMKLTSGETEEEAAKDEGASQEL